MPSLRCLISALAQAGGGDLLFRFASSIQSCCGEGGALQADIAVCGEHSPCSSHTGFAPLTGVCAFPVYTAQAPGCSIWSGPCVECGSSFWVLHKSADLVAPAFCVFPASVAQAARAASHFLPSDPSVRGFPGDWKLPLLRLPSRYGSPPLALLSPFLSFIFCPTSLRRQWAAFLGA